MAKNAANICDQISHKSGHAERGCRIIQFKMGRSLSSFSLISTFLQTVKDLGRDGLDRFKYLFVLKCMVEKIENNVLRGI